MTLLRREHAAVVETIEDCQEPSSPEPAEMQASSGAG